MVPNPHHNHPFKVIPDTADNLIAKHYLDWLRKGYVDVADRGLEKEIMKYFWAALNNKDDLRNLLEEELKARKKVLQDLEAEREEERKKKAERIRAELAVVTQASNIVEPSRALLEVFMRVNELEAAVDTKTH